MNNGDLYKQLYTVLEQNLFFGDRLSEREFVTLLVPGQFVSGRLNKRSADDQFSLFDLTNKTMDSTFLWRPQTSTVSGLYGEIVEFAALPDRPVDQALIKRLSTQLDAWQDGYDAFRQLFDDADSAWRKATSQDPVDENLVIDLGKKRTAALRNWENPNKGRKKLYEETLGELNQHLSGNPRAFWETEVRQRFADRRRDATNGSFYETIVDPHPSDWAISGWETHHLQLKSVFEREYSRSTTFSVGGGVNFGLWSAGGSYSKSTQATQAQTRVSDLRIDLDILRVNIRRPWLYQDIFARRFWAWKKRSHENLLITDGGDVPAERPLGPRGIPVLPTTFFVVRNVRLSGDWGEDDRRYYAEQIRASASFGWGCFSCSGSYSESTSERTYTGDFQSATIRIDQPQIIAVGGILLPRSPDPNPGLGWSTRPGEEPWLTPPAEPEDLRLVSAARDAQLEERIRRRATRELLQATAERIDFLSLDGLVKAAAELSAR